jgi:preprotein translocase subunit SecG
MGSFGFSLLVVAHIVVGCAVIGFVLLQHGKGADMGAAFGSGASGSLFGASGSANFLSRTTAILATIFFLTSLGLTYLASGSRDQVPRSLMDGVVSQSAPVSSESLPVPQGQDIPK